MSSFYDIHFLLPFTLTVLIAFTFHEFAHAWTAFKLGDDTAERQGRVSLSPFVHIDLFGLICIYLTKGFGWARPVPINPARMGNPKRDEILVTAAGPVSNFLLAVISIMVFGFLASKGVFVEAKLKAIPALKFLRDFLNQMVYLNFLLFFFNLLPIYPLDGSHILARLLPLNQAYRYKQFTMQYGSWILIGALVLGQSLPHHINPFYWLITFPTNVLIKFFIGFWI